MIGRIHGILLEHQATELLVDVHGVAYQIFAPMTTIYQLPDTGQPVTLYIHLIVREDAQILYGFFDKRERQLFRALIKVSGVGPRLALTILSGIEGHDFVRCVHANDVATLVRLPGVGKKTAERLLIDMRDRLHDWPIAAIETNQKAHLGQYAYRTDAESALVALGYKLQEASKAVTAVLDQGFSGNDSAQLVKLALQAMIKP